MADDSRDRIDLWLDTDPGFDDWMAWLLLEAEPYGERVLPIWATHPEGRKGIAEHCAGRGTRCRHRHDDGRV